MRRAGLQKVRLKERRDIGAAVTIAQRPTFGKKRRFDHASAASGLAQQPDILSIPRHVSKVREGYIAAIILAFPRDDNARVDAPIGRRPPCPLILSNFRGRAAFVLE
jgi:hypothetical protein